MNRNTAALLLLTSALAGTATAQVSAHDRAWLSSLRSSDLPTDQRIAEYEKLLQHAPEDPTVKLGLAKAFMQKLRETTDFAYLNRASALVEQVLKTAPADYDAIRILIEIETHRHNFPKAAELADKLVTRNPSDAGVLAMLGDSWMEMGRYDDAGSAYGHMLELGGNLASYNRVAWHEFVTGNREKALAWMNLAVQAGSTNPENLGWCMVEFGDLLFKSGFTEQARALYDSALEAFPRSHRAHAALGRLLAATGEYGRALEHFKRAQDMVPLPDYAAALDTLYAKAGNAEKAAQQRELVDVVAKLAAANGERGNRALALIFADQNRNLDRAAELVGAELETRKDVYTYDVLSWVLFRQGRQQEAEQASIRALAFHTPEPMFLYHAGVIALAGGRTDDGRQMLRRALDLNPNFSFPQADDARSRVNPSMDATGGPGPRVHGCGRSGRAVGTAPFTVEIQEERASDQPGTLKQVLVGEDCLRPPVGYNSPSRQY